MAINIEVSNGVTFVCVSGEKTTRVPMGALRTMFQMNDNPIFAVKLIREFTGLGLRDSKDIVDLYRAIREAAKFA